MIETRLVKVVAIFIQTILSFELSSKNIKLIVTLLDSLGFVVHPNKSIFVPARSIEDLSFVTDSQSMAIYLTKKKNACTKQLCHEVLQEEFLMIRKTARLLGKFTSSFPAMRFGPLHYRSLGQDKIIALKFT